MNQLTNQDNNRKNNFTGYAAEGFFGIVINVNNHVDLPDGRRVQLTHPMTSKDISKLLKLLEKSQIRPIDSFESSKEVISLDDL